jgi:hypothetical protein
MIALNVVLMALVAAVAVGMLAWAIDRQAPSGRVS